jgi:tRNA pseudouridine55 synthase
VRALARDLGEALGTGAALSALRRVRSEPFGLERALTLAEIEAAAPGEAWRRAGIPLSDALAHRPALALDPAEARAIGHGQPIRRATGVAAETHGFVLRDGHGVPLALAERALDPGDASVAWFQPRVVFPWAVREGAA